MAGTLIESGLTVLGFARRITLGLLEGIADDAVTHQPIPNANHALWVMGHLAHTDNYFLTAVASQPSKVPTEWDELFGMGSQPTADARRYPSRADLMDRLRARREDLIAWLRTLSDAQAARPLAKELQGFAPTFGSLAHSIAWHEGLHAGQLTVVRKSLGIAPLSG